MTFEEMLHEALTARGLTQNELATLAGCSSSLLTLIKQGRRVPRPDKLRGIARALRRREVEVYEAILESVAAARARERRAAPA